MTTSLALRCRTCVRDCLRTGPEHYNRARDLPRLIPSTAFNALAVPQPSVVDTLARKLRAERMRGRAGHWTYDINRHIALWQALLAERRNL